MTAAVGAAAVTANATAMTAQAPGRVLAEVGLPLLAPEQAAVLTALARTVKP
jgi:hypothetical protein